MNILIKLMSIVSLVIAPTLAQVHGTAKAHGAAKHETIEVTVEKTAGEATEAPIVSALKADGLVDSSNFTIEVANGQLLINGVAQDSATFSKYKGLLKEGEQNLKIEIKQKQ